MKEFTSDEIADLNRYVRLEGTEIADYLNIVMELYEVPESHGKRAALQLAIEKELWHWLKRFRKEATIITKTVPQPDQVIEELEWY